MIYTGFWKLRDNSIIRVVDGPSENNSISLSDAKLLWDEKGNHKNPRMDLMEGKPEGKYDPKSFK